MGVSTHTHWAQFEPDTREELMNGFRWIRSPVVVVGALLWMWGCGGPPDPVVEMQKSLASAPEYMITLEDMRQEGSFFPAYYHQYTLIQGERKRTTGWVEVSESVYQKYEPFLGMALVAKSDKGVNDTPHPAGYHYVGNPQYGHWGGSGGSSFWVFYGQYAMMRSLMGMGGQTVGRADYDNYRGRRDRRQPYYGSKRQYGTNGSLTKQQKPSFFERRKQSIARRRSSFSQKARSRIGRSRSGFGSRSGGFGK